jgi:hypothetical protein
MSANPEWLLTVPADDVALGEELRRHGVKPGQRLQVAVLTDDEELGNAEELPAFFSSFDGPADLGARAKDILRAELPRSR